MVTIPDGPRPRLTAGDVLEQIAEVEAVSPLAGPRATRMTFDSARKRFHLELASGTILEFEASVIHELREATDAELARMELSPSGSGVSWPDRDVDLSVEGLVLDLLAGPEWRQALRRHVNRDLARIRTPATARASRENGRKGGRPRKHPAT